jgi:8-amino-7-oxononanoate synthase
VTSPVDGWAEAGLSDLSARGHRRHLEPLEGAQGALVRLSGETVINFSSNDYLGLSADGRLSRALRDATVRYGVGSGASRLVVGDSLAHRELEAQLARLMGTAAARLFNSGYAANLGVLSALLGPEDVVFSDGLNHASLVDGCRLSRAKVVVYPHADVAALAQMLATHPGRRQLVVTDAVFSMDGDWAPLEQLVPLCEQAGAGLLVDEAHAFGVLGPSGAGLCAELGLAERVPLRMGTLGKSAGAYGAFVACSEAVADWLTHRARSLVFSTSLPASLCAAASAGVEALATDEALRERLWRNIRRLSAGLEALGLPAHGRSPIFPVVLGDPVRAVEASRALRERQLLVKPIRPPTVPEGTSRLRVSVSAAHSEGNVDLLLSALAELGLGAPGGHEAR